MHFNIHMKGYEQRKNINLLICGFVYVVCDFSKAFNILLNRVSNPLNNL